MWIILDWIHNFNNKNCSGSTIWNKTKLDELKDIYIYVQWYEMFQLKYSKYEYRRVEFVAIEYSFNEREACNDRFRIH